jgi:hypothetical protein
MSDGTREARTAAQWWADQLTADGGQQTGDAGQDLSATRARGMVRQPTEEQVEIFRAHVEGAILAMLREDASGWDDAVARGEPRRGAALRAVATDYGPGPLLDDAMKAAGLSRLLLPMKTCMWVNPEQVTVGLGYNAAPVELVLIDE